MAAEIVVDASVAIAWLMQEPNWKAARAVLARGALIIAPDLIFIETASAMAKRIWREEITKAKADSALDQLRVLIDDVIASPPLVTSALRLASDLRCSAYDALYLAIAEKHDAVMVTADFKLADKAEAGGLGRLVERLAL